MVMTKKRFNYTMSKKFPTGEIASITFGTDIEDDIPDTDEARSELFQKSVESTYADMRIVMKKDKIAKSTWMSLQSSLKNEVKVSNAKKKLKEYE